jgi:hypothetical protein
MNHSTKGRKLLRTWFAATSLAAAGVCFAQAAGAEKVWVKQATLPIRESKSGFSTIVANANKGDELTVLGREDKWVKVQLGDKQGYVFEAMISDKKVGAGPSMGNLMAGGDSTSGMTTGEAIKGLDPIAEKYAESKNLSPKLVDAMIDRNRAISEKDREAFQKEGKVGDAGNK